MYVSFSTYNFEMRLLRIIPDFLFCLSIIWAASGNVAFCDGLPSRHRDSTRIDPVETYSIFSMAMKNQHLDDADVFGQTVLHRAAYRGATVCSMLLMQVSQLKFNLKAPQIRIYRFCLRNNNFMFWTCRYPVAFYRHFKSESVIN